MQILKIGGNEIDDPTFVKTLGKTLLGLTTLPIVVHGGGKEIKALQERLGVTPQYVDGLRVTDAESLAMVKMVLAGRVNKRLVARLSDVGLDVFGMSGVDRTSIKAKKLEHPEGDLGFVGQITQVRNEVFENLLDYNVIPILSPICYGDGGDIFNVNADHVAVALAIALGAEELVFVSNVPGVLQDNKLISQLTPTDVETLMKQKVIEGGMIPKVTSALKAVAKGVPSVRITNLDGLQKGAGTTFKSVTQQGGKVA